MEDEMRLTGEHIRKLYEFLGGDFDAEVTVQYLLYPKNDAGDALDPGLYVWHTEYPEEGMVQIGPLRDAWK